MFSFSRIKSSKSSKSSGTSVQHALSPNTFRVDTPTPGSSVTNSFLPNATKEEMSRLQSHLAESIKSQEDPTGPALINGEPLNPTTEEQLPPLFAPGTTLRRQRHRRVVTADWRNFVASMQKDPDGTLNIPVPKDGNPAPLVCTGYAANVEDQEPDRIA